MNTLASDELPPSIAHSDTVFIGTSLFAYGIPRQGQGMLHDRSTHTRLAWPRMNESQIVDLLDRVLQTPGVKTVVIEVSPFIRDFRSELEPRSPTLIGQIRGLSQQFKQDSITLMQHFLSRNIPVKSKFIDEPLIDRKVHFDKSDFERLYPLSLRMPLQPERLQEALRVARGKSVDVLFVLPPRSQAAVDFMGPEQALRFLQRADAFGRAFGVPVWNAGLAWDNQLFVDHAHLNRRGRDKFIAFLKAYAEQSHVQ